MVAPSINYAWNAFEYDDEGINHIKFFELDDECTSLEVSFTDKAGVTDTLSYVFTRAELRELQRAMMQYLSYDPRENHPSMVKDRNS